MYASPGPANGAWPFIGIVYRNRQHTVCFLRKDLSAGRMVWQERTSTSPGTNIFPRIDPSGEWVGWSQSRTGSNSTSAPYAIALRAVRDPASIPPTLLGTDYTSAYFCDFTEDGTLLANISSDGTHYRLVVMDKTGRVLHNVDTEVPPKSGAIATWRKYGHR